MSTPTHDYDTLEREYVQSDISFRALAAKHDIKSFSAVAAYARQHDWAGKRDRLRRKVAEKSLEKVSEVLAEQEADIVTRFREESLTVIRAALYKFAEDLKDPQFKVRPEDLVKLISTGLLITGQPTARVEERRLDITASFEGADPDVLRRIVESTRPRELVRGGEAIPVRRSPEGARQN